MLDEHGDHINSLRDSNAEHEKVKHAHKLRADKHERTLDEYKVLVAQLNKDIEEL
jgi:hypothetical protein